MDILKEICDKRRSQIEIKGFSFGHKIPEERKKPVVPFLPKAGTILEIKRASPSKGMISADLNAAKTAKAYVKAGTMAISCLTEENYFHGNLLDLQAAAKAAGKKASLLRKDFLLEEEEIEVAYKCGADAVLLIARILEQEKLISMAHKAFSLGISVLLEIREDSDIEKAFYVLSLAHKINCDDKIVLGINSRDLKNFTIDLLIPLKLKERIKKIYKEKGQELPFPRIISESGVTTPQAAAFVGNIGFHSVLIGEAAAKNPKEAKKLVQAFTKNARKTSRLDYEYKFWNKIAAMLEEKKGPLVKICGLKKEEDAVAAALLGADILGFIFAEKSARSNSTDDLEKIKKIRVDLENMLSSGKIKKFPLMIGVIVDPSSPCGNAAYEFCYQGILDGIQYHACPEKADGALGYPAIPLADDNDLALLKESLSKGFPRILIDAKNINQDNANGDCRYGGTGKNIPAQLVEKVSKQCPLWLSGGISEKNVKEMIKRFNPELVDVCSGIESEPGVKDLEKMKTLFMEINK
ncbi:MAG: bifunctional indole-3-glycerol phosphate synthase/phosphoribosylanthranilate isomerase [Treponema sp.]|nr:bifunctional indole-3-glycerol phosphate synthase/phosphoribosylanthranilate isomerase [Treponema sp.]